MKKNVPLTAEDQEILLDHIRRNRVPNTMLSMMTADRQDAGTFAILTPGTPGVAMIAKACVGLPLAEFSKILDERYAPGAVVPEFLTK